MVLLNVDEASASSSSSAIAMGRDLELVPNRRGMGCCLCKFLQLVQSEEEVERTEGSRTS